MKLLSLLLLFVVAVTVVKAVPVYVMLSLTTLDADGNLVNAAHFAQQMRYVSSSSSSSINRQLKDGGVAGVMTDVWWGIVEKSPRSYDWHGYMDIMKILKDVGLKAEVVMSFHACGGAETLAPRDDCSIPLPRWVLDYEIWYTDVRGKRDREYISLGSDNVVISGRTVLTIYRDFQQSFANTFAEYFKAGIISQVQVGAGPSGELRYPSFSAGWNFPGIGAFQSFDSRMVASWKAYAAAHGHPEWNSPPTDAGYYNSRPWDNSFFSGGYTSSYGTTFLTWYSNMLIQHGDDILKQSRSVFVNSTSGFKTTISAKIAGLHWWYDTDSHAAELLAGYYNTRTHDGYASIMQMFKRNGVYVDFTCFEMHDQDQHDCDCSPESLVKQTLLDSKSAGVPYGAENALEFYDTYRYDKIVDNAKSVVHLDGFTYLRLSDTLLSGSNWSNFVNFVSRMANL